jgi:hypothetical protein
MKNRQKMLIKQELLEEIIEHKGDELLYGVDLPTRDAIKMRIAFRGGFVYCIDWLKKSGFDIELDRSPEVQMGYFTRMLEASGL